MNFDLSDDQREIRRTAREFLAARYPLETVRRIALDGEPDPHWDEIAGLGWPDIGELGIVELAVLAEQLGYALAPSPLASTWAAKLLHPALAGRGTVAMWEDGNADPERPGLRADGGLTGTKIAVPHADVADTLVVTAEGGRHFAVAASDATVEPAAALDTTRPLFTVRFDGAPGEEITDTDFSRAWHAIAVMAAAESVGVAARVTAMAVDYAKERRQFGRAIGSFQTIKHRLADLACELEAARELVYGVASLVDANPAKLFAREASMAKLKATELAKRIALEGMQMMGGYGYATEYDMEAHVRHTLVTTIYGGASEIQREIIARSLGL
jgi:alkylation response protein AidB-like acyl-CoA dehydrogenase